METGTTVCIVLNYNDADTTIGLARELKESRELDRILLVDNCSVDHSWERLRGLEDGRRCFALRTARNGGYGSGNQAGIVYACRQFQPEYIAIANPDIHISDSCIRRVREALEREPSGGAASAVVKSPEGKETFSYWDLQPMWKELLDTGLVTRRLFRSSLRTPRERLARAADPAARFVGALPGSFFMLHMGRIERAGLTERLFDPEVFLYCEEKILAQKLREAGLCELLTTDVSYVHAHSVSIDKSIGQIARKQALLHQSKLWYFQRYLNGGPVEMAAARLFLGAVLLEVRFLTQVLGLRW